MSDTTYKYTVPDAAFKDGTQLTGSWEVTYDPSGAIVSLSDVDVTLIGPEGSTTFTGLGTLPYANPATSANGKVDYYDVHNFGGQTNNDYPSLYLDWTSETPTALAKQNDGGNLFTSISYDTTPGDDATLTTFKLTAAAPLIVTEVICFMAGTMVATPGGRAAIETLAIGDMVSLSDGGVAPIRWIGRNTVSTRFADPLRVLPIRVRANALDDNLPERDLLVSACHALLLDGILVQAGALVNGTSIVRDSEVPEIFVYYHIELADHSLILAEGVPAETFVDNVDRMNFDNWEEHEALAGSDVPIVEIEIPRAKSARQVPVAMRKRLMERASKSVEAAVAA